MSEATERVRKAQARIRVRLAQEKLRLALEKQAQGPDQLSGARRQQVFDALGKVASKEDPNALINLPKDPNESVLGRFERANLPAIGATIATVVRRGKGKGFTPSALKIPPRIQQLMGKPSTPPIPGALATSLPGTIGRVAVKPAATVTTNATKAAIGGGIGGILQEGTETPLTDRFVNNAVEQGITDPLARLTLGVSKLLLRPIGKVGSEAIERMMSFARQVGAPVDPGKVTGNEFAKIVSNFAQRFFGSTIQARIKLGTIARLISANPEDGRSIINYILKNGPGLPAKGGTGQFLVNAQRAVVGVVQRVKGKATKQLLIAAGKDNAGEAAEIIFRDAATATQVKANMTKKGWNDLVISHVENMIKRSSTGGVIDGDILGNILRENRTNLSQLYPQGLLSRLQNLAVYAKAHGTVPAELADPAFFSPKAMATNIVGTGVVAGVGTAAAAADPTGISTAVIGVSTIFASQVFNPNSLTSKWLTTGLVPKVVLDSVASNVVANVAVRKKIGGVVTDTGLTEAAKGNPRPIQDAVGGFIDRRLGDVKRLSERLP